jgi:hypothetical protein
MTEAEWLTCDDPTPMVALLGGQASERLLRLFACACCRRVWHLLDDQRLRSAVELAERMAVGRVSEEETYLAKAATCDAGAGAGSVEDLVMTALDRRSRLRNAVWLTAGAVWQHYAWRHHLGASRGRSERHFAYWWREELSDRTQLSLAARPDVSAVWTEELAGQCVLLRCLFGNPFRPSPTLPRAVLNWNDDTVKRIAQGIYEERKMPEGTLDAGRLRILADALLDAGCEDEDLMQHCRSDGPHVRGCWAVDLILAKT